MDAGRFQRYVWVQGERKRQRNRDKYEETRKRFLDNEVEEVESPKKARVVWPGEFEKQLKKRDRNLAKLEERRNDTPAVHTPSDSQSLSSEEIEKLSDEEDKKVEELPRRQPKKVEKVEKVVERQEGDITTDGTHYLDEFLDSPKKLNPTKSGGSFFLVSSNLVDD